MLARMQITVKTRHTHRHSRAIFNAAARQRVIPARSVLWLFAEKISAYNMYMGINIGIAHTMSDEAKVGDVVI